MIGVGGILTLNERLTLIEQFRSMFVIRGPLSVVDMQNGILILFQYKKPIPLGQDSLLDCFFTHDAAQ